MVKAPAESHLSAKRLELPGGRASQHPFGEPESDDERAAVSEERAEASPGPAFALARRHSQACLFLLDHPIYLSAA